MRESGPGVLAGRYVVALAAAALLPSLAAGLHGHVRGSGRWAVRSLLLLVIIGFVSVAQRQIARLRRGMNDGRWTEVELEPLRRELERPLWRIVVWLSLGLYGAVMLLKRPVASPVWSCALVLPMTGYAALTQLVRRPKAAMFAGLE